MEGGRRNRSSLISLHKAFFFLYLQLYLLLYRREMSPSFHSASSSILLYSEDNDIILGVDDEEEKGGERPSCASGPKRCKLFWDFHVGSLAQSEDWLALLMGREQEHLPREDYCERLRSGSADLSIRRDAIDWIRKVHAHYKFGPLSAYLSINYLDRFLSSYELPKGKAWTAQLLSVACLSLAAKMEETGAPVTMDLQVDEAGYLFEARTIQRMELVVLSTLGWKMQAVTPFSYIDFYLHKISGGIAPTEWMLCQSANLILSTAISTDFLGSRPSVVAAAIALLVVVETQADVENILSCCDIVTKERIMECYEKIRGTVLMRKQPLEDVSSALFFSVPLSLVGLLDATCLSYRSDGLALVPHAPCLRTSPVSKRIKISR